MSMAPSWILDIFAAIMLAVAAISAARLVPGSPLREPGRDVDIDIAHLLMGISMAGMLAAGLRTLPNVAWEVTFAALTAWFAWPVFGEARRQGVRVLADGHRVPHLVHSAAMVYMFAAPGAVMTASGRPAMSGMHVGGAAGSAMGSLRLPALAFVFALWLSVYVVLDLDRLSGPGGHPHGSYFARMAVAPAGAALAGTSAAGGLPATVVGTSTVPDEQATDGPGDHSAVSDPDAPSALALSRRLAAGCRIAMGVTMAFMLVIMI